MTKWSMLKGFLIAGVMFSLSLNQLSCSGGGSDGPPINPNPCPNGISVVQIGETEVNNQADSADDISWRIPEDQCTKLQIVATLRSDGTVFGEPNGDAFDLFSFILPTEGTYNFELSELTAFNLDLELYTRESFTVSNQIPGVNYFSSPVDAPSEGNIEFFSAPLKPGVEYFIQVRAYDTDDINFNYSVFIEKTQ